jgi:hypothetical protein
MAGATRSKQEIRAANLRAGLILVSIVVAFFFGIMIRYWIMR